MYQEQFLSRKDLETYITDKIKPEDVSKIIGAYDMAEIAMQGLKNSHGVSQFRHTTRICRIITEELKILETDLIIAALLHNILLHNTGIAPTIIDYNFGSYVAYLVQIVTDDYYSRYSDYIKLNIDTLDDDAMILILTDCLDELRSIDFGEILNPIGFIENIKNRYFIICEPNENESIKYLISEIKKERNKILG